MQIVRASVLFFIFYSAFLIPLWLGAKEINNHRWRYSVNILASWLPAKGHDSSRHQVFRSPDNRLSLAIEAWERREIAGLEAMYTNHLLQLKGVGVVSRYQHMSYEVLLARIEHYSAELPLPTDGDAIDSMAKPDEQAQSSDNQDGPNAPSALDSQDQPVHNAVTYAFYFYGAQYAYRVTSTAPLDASSLERDIQYSVLDSFGFEGHNHWNQGPISSFFISQKQQKQLRFSNWRLGNHQFRILQRPAAEQVAQTVLEREKRILGASAKPLNPYALERFYYMNFRQNYQLLKDLAGFLQKKYQQQAQQDQQSKKDSLQPYEYLLYDLQAMVLQAKKDTIPLAMAVTIPTKLLAKGAGNIETLALIYVILSSHFRHNTILLYSNKYAELLVGVEEYSVSKKMLEQKYRQNQQQFQRNRGVTITWFQNRYLMGDLTERTYIGWTRATLRDLDSWSPLTFPRYTHPNFFP